MAAGWNLQQGDIINHCTSEEELWASFRFVFSDRCMKRSTYKYGLIKSILDNILSVEKTSKGLELSYDDLFYKFAANYWNLVTKYHLKQMRGSTISVDTEIEKIFNELVARNRVFQELEFDNLSIEDRDLIVSRVAKMCKRCVVGALYQDFSGQFYGFDLKSTGIWINPSSYEFILKYKPEIEQLNYYAWAKFLETINSGEALQGVIANLELATPRRADLSLYRFILQTEFETNTCFYCGSKLSKAVHVDHVIPWSFVKSDHLWNFVLACPKCNLRKHDRLPSTEGIASIIARNEKLRIINKPDITSEFRGYSADLLLQVWKYAKQSGLKTMG